MGVVVRTESPGRRSISLERLCAIILMGGGIRPDPFSQAVGRPLYDLPIASDRTLFDQWMSEASALSQFVGAPILHVRLMVGELPAVARKSDVAGVELSIEQDPVAYRGTGGVLRDLCTGYGGDDLLLVANASQLLLSPLVSQVKDLAAAGGDVAIASNLDGTPTGMFLIAARALQHLPEHGFLDLKEQALPLMAQRHDLRVVHHRNALALPVRTHTSYIAALRVYHRRQRGEMDLLGPFEETWGSSFQVMEGGSRVDEKARLHDSVVLEGGHVEAGAVIVNSVVCPGGTVVSGKTAVDELVGPSRRWDSRS